MRQFIRSEPRAEPMGEKKTVAIMYGNGFFDSVSGFVDQQVVE